MRVSSTVGIASAGVFVVLSALATTIGAWKLLGISWVAFAAMALGIPLGRRTLGDRSWALVWGYGLAAGAMITSAAVFLVPQAIAHDANFGGSASRSASWSASPATPSATDSPTTTCPSTAPWPNSPRTPSQRG